VTSQRVEILGAGNKYPASDLLSASYDLAKLHPMASLGEQLDYLVLDDDKTSNLPRAGSDTAIPSRGWSDDLCYGTGTMYLGGMSSMLLAINTVFHNSFRVQPDLSKFHLIGHLIVFVLTTCPYLLQAWPSAARGAFGRVRADSWQCRMRGYESTASLTPLREGGQSWVIRLGS
jgi:hypothetical protein